MSYLFSVNLFIIEGFLDRNKKLLQALYAQTKFICLLSNAYLFYFVTFDVN